MKWKDKGESMNEEWLIETVEIDRETIEEILRESLAICNKVSRNTT